jgi:hypothetical protein
MAADNRSYEDWCEAIERDCPPGHAPVDPCVVYHPERGFVVTSRVGGLPDGAVLALPRYEPYGTSRDEFEEAIRFMEVA